MADFCQQCSEAHFGEDTRDLAGLTTKANEAEGRYVLVLCECCGPIQVDSEGRCIHTDVQCECRRQT